MLFRRRRRVQPGEGPGQLVVDPSAPRPALRVLSWDDGELDEGAPASAGELRDWIGKHRVTWVDVVGLGDVRTIARLGELFGLHPLALEDVVNVHQRPKVEEYGGTRFVVLRIPDLSSSAPGEGEEPGPQDDGDAAGARPPPPLSSEQVSLFLGQGFVLTFQEREGDCFEGVRHRIRRGSGRIRWSGADYLAYTLIDAAVDAWFPVLEGVGDRLERVEREVFERRQGTEALERVHRVKLDLFTLRRVVWPLRDALNLLLRSEDELITADTRVYLRDCHDHTVQIIDLLETNRELASGVQDLWLSFVNQRLNEVMRVLTVIATIFIPLTFIAGVYGMNFDREASPWNMPELGWAWGYPACLGIMAAAAVALFVWFRRKGWI